MSRAIKVILLLHLSSLAGCSLFQPEIVTVTKNNYLTVTCPDYPPPQPIEPKPIKPRAVFDQTGIAWVGLTPTDYEHLAINTQETIRYIKDQKGQVKYYRDCVVDFNAKIEELRAKESEKDE